jgi:thiol-disulfide isomerase/thioredoxin
MRLRFATTSLVALSLAGLAWAGGEGEDESKVMTIGDKAPPIEIAHWLRGEPLEGFEEGKVYVLEFWATWCGPCRASMPHLTELQEKYKDYDVTIIGVSDEPLSTVVDFLCTTDPKAESLWYEKIHYTLATDPDESVKKDYFRAAGQRGIPCSFIIGKDTHVEWIGHPMSMDGPLEDIVHDRWDRATFHSTWEAQQAKRRLTRDISQARRDQDWKLALELIDKALADDEHDIDLLTQKYQVLLAQNRGEEAEAVADELLVGFDAVIEEHPDRPYLRVQKFHFLLLELNRPDDAYALGGDLVKHFGDDANMLNSIAWTIVDDARVQKRDLDLAMKAAQRANELTKSQDAAILDTLARVHYEKGEFEMALKWQQEAVEHAGEGAMADGIRETLQRYKAEAKKGN